MRLIWRLAAIEVIDSGFRLIVWGLDDLVSVSFERESSVREGGVKFFCGQKFETN